MKQSNKDLNALLHFHSKDKHVKLHQYKAKHKQLFKSIYPITASQLIPSKQKRKKYRYKKLEKVLFAQHLLRSGKLNNFDKNMKSKIIQNAYNKISKEFKLKLKEEVLRIERNNTKNIIHKLQKVEKENFISNTLLETQNQPNFIIKDKMIKKRIKNNQKLKKTSIQKYHYLTSNIIKQPIAKNVYDKFRKDFKTFHHFFVPGNLDQKILSKTYQNLPPSTKEYLLKNYNKTLAKRQSKAAKIFKNMTPVKRDIFQSKMPINQIKNQQLKFNKTGSRDYQKFKKQKPEK